MTRTNPFPGMNPWLERHWGDIHAGLTIYARDQLQAQLPAGLIPRIDEYLAVEDANQQDQAEKLRRYSPDVLVTERSFSPGTASLGAVAELEAPEAGEPLVVRRMGEPITLRRLQIIDSKRGHRVVTSIEFLSPANKIGDVGRKQFQEKQASLLECGVNLVEIDLLRAGSWVLSVPKAHAPRQCREPYRVCVVRAKKIENAEMYIAGYKAPLPSIRIPLRPKDPDARLRLQPLVDAAYVNGRYGDDIDYGQPPEPPLPSEEAAWVEAWLRGKQAK